MVRTKDAQGNFIPEHMRSEDYPKGYVMYDICKGCLRRRWILDSYCMDCDGYRPEEVSNVARTLADSAVVGDQVNVSGWTASWSGNLPA